ncbi:MAG TPA: response regulator [Terriglobales bacterium]|nr:response regulator [Terriglobales bacterium]
MKTILVIEEEEVIRGLVRAILEGAGYLVLEAASGEAGFELACRGVADALVLDCLGRESNGIQTLRRLRGDAKTAHLPVIALSGLGQAGAEVGLWANALVVKPFRPAQLLLKVQMTLAAKIAAHAEMNPLQPAASA